MIDNFEFNPRYSEKAMTAATNWLISSKGQPLRPGLGTPVTAGAGFDKDGNTTIESWKAVCHRFFSESRDNAQLLTTVWGGARSGYKTTTPAKDTVAGKIYLNWFINDSPYSGYFVGPHCGDLDFISEHGVILSTDMPYTFLQNILIGTRALYEIPDSAVARWAELYQELGNGLLAYALALGSNASAGTTMPMVKATSHRIHCVPSTMQEAFNLIDGVFPSLPADKKNFFSSGCRSYVGGMNSAKPLDVTQDAADMFRYFFEDMLPDKFTKPAVNDPFAPPSSEWYKQSKLLPTYDQFLKEYLPVLKKIIEGRNNERKTDEPTTKAA